MSKEDMQTDTGVDLPCWDAPRCPYDGSAPIAYREARYDWSGPYPVNVLECMICNFIEEFE